jgi:hypothetical protein
MHEDLCGSTKDQEGGVISAVVTINITETDTFATLHSSIDKALS